MYLPSKEFLFKLVYILLQDTVILLKTRRFAIMNRRLNTLAVIVAVLMLVSLGNVPAQNTTSPKNGFGELYRFKQNSTDYYNQTNNFQASNETHLLRSEINSYVGNDSGSGNVDVFFIGEEYNALVSSYLSDNNIRLDQTPSEKMSYAQINYFGNMTTSSSEENYVWDIEGGVQDNYSNSFTNGPFPSGEQQIVPILFNDTYNVIFEEMQYPLGPQVMSFYLDFVNADLNFTLTTYRQITNEQRSYDIGNGVNSYSTVAVNTTSVAMVTQTFNVTLYLGDEYDPNTPTFDTQVSVFINVTQYSMSYFNNQDGKILEWENVRDSEIASHINDTKLVTFTDYNGSTFNENLTIVADGSHSEGQSESGVIFNWLPPMMNFPNSHFKQGDKFVYEGSVDGQFDNTNSWMDYNSSSTDSRSVSFSGTATQTIEVARAMDQSFAGFTYGSQYLQITENFVDSNGGSSTNSRTEKKTNFNVLGNVFSDPNREIVVEQGPNYDFQMDYRSLQLHEMGRRTFVKILPQITINGFTYTNLAVDATEITYEVHENNTMDGFMLPPDVQGWDKVDANATRIIMYDPQTKALIGIVEGITFDLLHHEASNFNGTMSNSIDDSKSGEYWSRLYLSHHPTSYNSAQSSTSTVSTSNNSSTSANNTSTDSNSSLAPTLSNPLPGFELTIASIAILGIMVVRRRKN